MTNATIARARPRSNDANAIASPMNGRNIRQSLPTSVNGTSAVGTWAIRNHASPNAAVRVAAKRRSVQTLAIRAATNVNPIATSGSCGPATTVQSGSTDSDTGATNVPK